MVKWSNRLIGEAQLNPSIPARQTVAAVHWFDFFFAQSFSFLLLDKDIWFKKSFVYAAVTQINKL